MTPLLGFTAITVILLLVSGLYSLMATRNLIRVLVSLEIMMKAVTLLLVAAGYITGRVELAQAMVITLVIIEVVAVAVAAGLAVGLFRRNNTLDIGGNRNFKDGSR